MGPGFRLVVKKRSDGRLLLTVPYFYRLVLLAIGTMILAFMILSPPDAQGGLFVAQNTLPLLVCSLSFIGAAYQERWIFDKRKDTAVYQFGLAVLHLNRRFRISEMQELVIERFVKGRLDRAAPARRTLAFVAMLALALRGRDGSMHRLEAYSAARKSLMEETARAIALYCELPLVHGEEWARGDG